MDVLSRGDWMDALSSGSWMVVGLMSYVGVVGGMR